MQVPYIVGRWVRGDDHYARHSLIRYLLRAEDTAYWVVGTRRMGKTSLLRQIEMVTRESDLWVPLFWDLQGCTTPEELSAELRFALEDEADRFAASGVDAFAFAQDDAVTLLRRLGRQLVGQGRRLLLLVDEAEVLIDIAGVDGSWLARLRKALLEGHQRTIVASTKLLSRLTDQSLDWVTSPFLFGFRLMNLWPFDKEGAVDLICQTQSHCTVEAPPEVVAEILAYTNNHPHLIQYLCQRLFVPVDDHSGRLHHVEEGDLAIDHLLEAYFRIDFEQLDPAEKEVLLTVSDFGTATTEQVLQLCRPWPEASLTRALQDLTELGQLLRSDDAWAIGNAFLRRWLREHHHELRAKLAAPAESEARLDEANVASMAQALGVGPLPSGIARHIEDEESFFATVRSLFGEVRHLVEQDDGHRLLVNTMRGGSPILRSEEEVQIALKHWLRPLCRGLDIDLNREPLTGRGYLDFKFSIGHRFRCLVEVKLFNSSKLHEGVAIQLPLYLLSDRARYGIYVPVFLEWGGYDAAIAALHELAAARARSHGVLIDVIDIRAWKPTSASKAEEVEPLERYLWRSTTGR